MLLNNAVSAAVGFVPLVGDIVLAAYKANSRNAALLEDFLRKRGEAFLRAESERAQNGEVVRPGAGIEPGEHVPGKVEKKNSGGWFRRRSTKEGKGKGVDKSVQSTPGAGGTRFVENVPAIEEAPKKK